MKTRYKITLIVIALLVIMTTALISNRNAELNNESGGRFNYRDTVQIIDETYLDKNISQWQKESNDSLMSYHAIHGDSFFVNLGALVIKNEMIHQLKKQNIHLANSDFNVYNGMILTSLPPHVSFEAFVNSTDGNTYRLSGMTMRATVNEPIHITKLQFFDTSEELPLESILSQNNTIIIYGRNNEPEVNPRNFLTSGNSEITVNFQNNALVPIRIQGDGDWQNPNWYGPTILPLTTGTMTFENYGVYEWHSRTLPVPRSIATDHMGGGAIHIIPEDVSKLTFQDKEYIGTAILQNSEIPWGGMWSNNNGIMIDFNRAIFDALPNAREYYKARAEQLIPFDIPIIIEEPYGVE